MIRPNVLTARLLVFSIVVMLLGACTAVSTLPDAIGSGYIAIETLADQTADSQELSAEQKGRIRSDLQAAKDHLDTATELYSIGATDGAQNRLTVALQILTVVEEVLRNVES